MIPRSDFAERRGIEVINPSGVSMRLSSTSLDTCLYPAGGGLCGKAALFIGQLRCLAVKQGDPGQHRVGAPLFCPCGPIVEALR